MKEVSISRWSQDRSCYLCVDGINVIIKNKEAHENRFIIRISENRRKASAAASDRLHCDDATGYARVIVLTDACFTRDMTNVFRSLRYETTITLLRIIQDVK